MIDQLLFNYTCTQYKYVKVYAMYKSEDLIIKHILYI